MEKVKKLLIFILTAYVLGACGAEGGLEVREPWMRPAAQGENGAIYFVIDNRGSNPDALSGASTDVAEVVEMHESRMNGDVMQMQQLDSVPLERSSETKFEPGGLHLMLVGLKKDLQVGEEVPITLHFTNAEDITVSVPVADGPVTGENHSAPEH
jgi:copper(I)-binding protein